MQLPPAKIRSAVVSGRFGLAGRSQLHYLLIQATTPGVGQGITSRWVARQCTPCHQSHPSSCFLYPSTFPPSPHLPECLWWERLPWEVWVSSAPETAWVALLLMNSHSSARKSASVCVPLIVSTPKEKFSGRQISSQSYSCKQMASPVQVRLQSTPAVLVEEKWVRPCSLSSRSLTLIEV